MHHTAASPTHPRRAGSPAVALQAPPPPHPARYSQRVESLLDPEEAEPGARVDKDKQIQVLIEENSRLVKVCRRVSWWCDKPRALGSLTFDVDFDACGAAVLVLWHCYYHSYCAGQTLPRGTRRLRLTCTIRTMKQGVLVFRRRPCVL